MTVTVLYSCNSCSITKQAVQVPERGPEDVVEWLQQTAALVGADHRLRSPRCGGTTCDLMIPQAAHNNARVGEATKN